MYTTRVKNILILFKKVLNKEANVVLLSALRTAWVNWIMGAVVLVVAAAVTFGVHQAEFHGTDYWHWFGVVAFSVKQKKK